MKRNYKLDSYAGKANRSMSGFGAKVILGLAILCLFIEPLLGVALLIVWFIAESVKDL